MVERGPGGDDSSSGEYVDVRLDSEAEGEGGHREPRPGPAGPAGHADQAATAAAKAAPAPGVRVIYDRLGQVVREPTGPPPIVLAVDAAEDEDSESSEHDVDEAAADTDDPGTAPLPHEMEPEFRHVSLAMSNAVCEVLRRNGNRRAEFHVLSIPPAAWKTTEGFVLQALPLTDNTRRHPNLLRCADGPTFAPPRVDEERSEMTDAELADDEEMAALRAEMDAEPAAHMHPSRGTSRRSTATAVPPPPAGHPRTRRQPWPSKYAPPVPTPAQTSAAGDGDESSRPSEDLTMTALTPAARMTNDEVEAAIADLELRTLIDELETEEMEAEASAVNTTSGPTVEPAPGGAASSSSGGTLVPVTPATASTMTSGRPVDTPLRSNRKLGAYLHNGLRRRVQPKADPEYHVGGLTLLMGIVHVGLYRSAMTTLLQSGGLCVRYKQIQKGRSTVKTANQPDQFLDILLGIKFGNVLSKERSTEQIGTPMARLGIGENFCIATNLVQAIKIVAALYPGKQSLASELTGDCELSPGMQAVSWTQGIKKYWHGLLQKPKQVSWNVAKSTLEGHKVTALLKQRARIWRHVEQWLRATPGRHGCLIVGDLNTPLTPEPGVCGPVPLVQNIAQQDQAELQAILRTYVCCALNSWTGTGAKARTFLPPTGDQTLQGTRIDFVIARGDLIDNEAKKAGVISAPFVPTSGARHRPVQAKIRLPSRPKPGAHPSSGRQPAQVCRQLRNPQVEAGLARNLSTLMDQSNPDADLDDLLLQGWEMTRSEDPGQHGRHELAPQQGLAVRHRIQHMWQLRASIRGNQPRTDDAGDLPSLASIWKAWIQVARLQACTRQLRKDCRRHKTLKIYEAVQAENVYAAAKQFAPRQVRRKLQLRTKDGQLMSHEQEFQCIKDYFTRLYHGPNPQPVALSQAVQFEPAEVQVAILKLSAGKAMPQHSAPAALWRTSVGQVASRLCSQINSCLGRGCHLLPERWSTSDMALIPKPGKAMTSPEQLRPISLLPMPAKALGSMLAERLHAHAYRYLQGIPQYAYMKGRHLGMALDRVASHCISTRRLLQDQANNLHARRSGRRAAQVCGGCMLSLDLSKAYDHVPWEDLACALRDAEVPPQLVELIILLHQQARIRITHHEQTELLRMYRGLRQGCSLAPALWTIYSGWLLKGLHATGEVDIPESNTSYADDFHFCWQVLRASDMERSYRAMRTVLQGLEERHVQVSLEKTVAIIDLQGPGAKKCLDRYLVRRPRCEGLFLKFMIAGEARYVKVKPSHTYLGVSISYKKPEQETAKLRLDLATGTFRRLKKILACRDVPLKLRLQLWQGTVLPTMLHGVDSMGLPLKEANQIMIVYFKQVRSVAKSFSMFTHETNQDLAKRLGLADPLQRLLQALDRRSCASKDLPEQLLPGMPQCRHCKYKFTTWHAFFYHINSRGCSILRALYEKDSHVIVAESLNEAVVNDVELLQMTQSCTWKDIAMHPKVRANHQHCPECHMWTVRHQYIKRHMLQKHPEQTAIIEQSEQLIVDKNKRQLEEATQELALLEGLNPMGTHQPGMSSTLPGLLGMGSNKPEPEKNTLAKADLDPPQQKYHKGDAKGNQGNQGRRGKGRGHGQSQSSRHQGAPSSTSWRGQQGPGTQGPPKSGPPSRKDPWSEEELVRYEPEEYQAAIKMLTTMMLRHEAQFAIQKQDTSYVVFIQTGFPDSVAVSTHRIAQNWHAMKTATPEKLEAPMRAILFQHFIKTVLGKLELLLQTLSSKSMAVSLGLLLENEEDLPAMKWDPENRKHVPDTSLPSMKATEAVQTLQMILQRCTTPLVISRYHATRKLAQEYQGDTLTMLLEVGLRTKEANEVWSALHRMEKSSAWVTAGTYLRREGMQRSALGKRLAMLNW
ncbi:LINE-1 retrotransposable element ORF2 protein [Symbiodinium microadriaticum]|uniref:LINE-1 retrotransposable element ORF2 protein n=1 Tax=Symbiodinium microadriaticum TaxID=2951 RepID=A0A1Q9CN72_SYMMI|nr:LINE-1 retrotransposable element ORF2 protein [Symbiodinium microadriaticum]